MINTLCRSVISTAMLGGLLVAPLAAQGANKQGTLEPHVQNQLWPTRKLSPAETDFKERVVAMRDTIISLQATVEQADRARRTRNSPAVVYSLSRSVGTSCGRVERNGRELKTFAAGLTTNDPRFGEPAIRRFRTAIDSLHRTMGRCQSSLDQITADGADKVDPDKILTVLNTVRSAMSNYLQAAEGLAKTLNIRIEATDKS